MSLKKLGRYDIVKPLGKGAMGLVYEAHDPNIDRHVAIKTIRVDQLAPELADEYESRFRAEARAGGRLQHPNIIGVYDAGRDEGMAFMVMELVRGGDLKQQLERGARLGLARSLSIMRELLSALSFAHEQGIIHRDIKPANVMLDSRGRVKLGDFGVARISHSGEVTRTQGSMVGTLKYMSPEQVQGLPVDARTDLFAAGVVLYQLLTGSKPFDGANDFAIMQAIAQREPPAPSSIDPGLPTAIDAVVAKALAKDRDARYATARDFMVDLRAAAVAAGARAAAGAVLADAGPAQPVRPGDRLATTPSRSMANARERDDDDEVSLASSSSSSRPARSPIGSAHLPPVGSDPSGSSPSALAQEMELLYWKDIQHSSDPVDFQGFLERFPAGIYAGLAARRLRRLVGSLADGTGSRSATGSAPFGRLQRSFPPVAGLAPAGSVAEPSVASGGASRSDANRGEVSGTVAAGEASASGVGLAAAGAGGVAEVGREQERRRADDLRRPSSDGDERSGEATSARAAAERRLAVARAAEEEARWQEALRQQTQHRQAAAGDQAAGDQASADPAPAVGERPTSVLDTDVNAANMANPANTANEVSEATAAAKLAAARRAEADRLVAEARRAAERRWLGGGGAGEAASPSSFIDLSTGPAPLASLDPEPLDHRPTPPAGAPFAASAGSANTGAAERTPAPQPTSAPAPAELATSTRVAEAAPVPAQTPVPVQTMAETATPGATAATAATSATSSAATATNGALPASRTRRLVLAVLAVLAFLALVVWWFGSSTRREPAHAAVSTTLGAGAALSKAASQPGAGVSR